MSDSKISWVAAAVITGGAVISTLYKVWNRKRGDEAVTRWADEQGFTIVEFSRPLFVPHWRASSSKRAQFFRVSLRDKQGLVRRVWIRCYAVGLEDPDSMDIEVIWDEK